MYRIIGADQKEYGPISADDLRRWIGEGRVNRHTLAWTPGMDAWRPLASFPDFAGAWVAPVYSVPPRSAPSPNTSGMAIVGLIFACLGIPCCMSILFPLLGLIFSMIGVAQTGPESGKTGRNLAIAGVVISVLTLLAAMALWIVAAIGAASDSGSHNYEL